MKAREDEARLSLVDAAITRVLDAEQQARADLERCTVEAHREVEAAHARARAIAARAARRVALVHQRAERTLTARLAAIHRERSALSCARPDDAEHTCTARAVERLANELIGRPG